MALKPVYLLLLWDLTLLIHGVTSFCNVTCSTDYDALLNCSCSGSAPTYPVQVQVSCRDANETVNDSCEINMPQSWCAMIVEDLYIVASIGTMCHVSASQHDDKVIMKANESSIWALSEVVKAQPPSNVQVINTDGFYNITWDSHNPDDCLTYRVRIRESKDLSMDPVHSISTETKYICLARSKLKPHLNYTVDVQAKMCLENLYHGPWSEWSSTAEWRTTATSTEVDEINGYWGYLSLAVIPVVLCFLLLGYSRKPFWQKKLQLITYIPRPNEFFKPLYNNYGGDFKEWVKPVFSENDYLRINSHVPTMSEKQHDILQWNNEKQGYSENNETKQGGNFLHMLQPHSNLLLHFQDGGSSQGTSHSMGHISIHTVTLSGEEFEGEVMSQSSINTLRESFGSFEDDNREHAGYDLGGPQLSGMDRQSRMLPHHENQISNELSVENINFQPRAQFNEPERISLDSFVSNEQSEDGYPHVDLDTIDSGFVECSSPGASDSNRVEQIDSDLFQEHKNSNSNYVKQWMICNAIQEDSGGLQEE
ncbi:interleukin 21 receptor, tandem duplicate 1 [Toxotes jaculatrix]|uniref:interleukin 21 receptor, tandem duplicate 1 n=1 Tax=Toxotes jaculatrix TaxID=941984 RepID=UPI001B3AE310|nr:interleukin 21 receptor, tandem duplicate 1 [Toxotes jaculatrix]XP_040900425.1 interleukin 21 receptor, tandem duplicate 1 [Toxotes jaculatrix]XP_040900426.1 interleukin 21 receptor, tandem duplicate 1 [Toxotes jaculatrix]XP_040900427.1 interleukin 21 receptor, tandem duplicate 1 [Toxotes jaculatrix]XP_040900428.1 interleukin 21 receptor, tandem duplicate 1 [Toxotes jaculatrix]XP_040900429.1 interleukin 21 receptor, tandem duplicate 1 [Toxotes jaculatrix]XP_040900430.1 interleukin 21 recep